jgi:hypothetical protein
VLLARHKGLFRCRHVRPSGCVPERPVFVHPPFDYENRIVTVQLSEITVASV